MKMLTARIPDDLFGSLQQVAEENGATISETVRKLLEVNLPAFKIEKEIDWKLLVRRIFNVPMNRIDYAASRSGTALEFFAYIADYLTEGKLTIREHPQKCFIIYDIQDKTFTSKTVDRSVPKIPAVTEVMRDLDLQIIKSITGGLDGE